MSESKTPETDAIVAEFSDPEDAMASPDFARKLELERDEARREIEKWKECVGHRESSIDTLRAELEKATAEIKWQENHANGLAEIVAQGEFDIAQLRAELAKEKAMLDWLESEIAKHGEVTFEIWDHDGRRQIDGCWLVHKFAERGGEDESLRAAITAAMKGEQ